jgi:hypothetical protein
MTPPQTPILTICILAAFAFGATVPQARADSPLLHFFDAPYACDRTREVTSSSTGVVRTVAYKTVYFPDRSWRLVLNDIGGDKSGLGGNGIALLFADGVRYDGSYRDESGPITDLVFRTAWPQENPSPTFSTRSNKDDDMARCSVLSEDDIAFYDIDYLGTLDVMN